MSEWFYKRLNYFFGLFSVCALFSLIIFAANIEVKDLDLWLHIAAGRYIMQHLAVPSVDVLSFTMAGVPWINHEWLFQVIAYTIYSNLGAEGLIYLQIAVVAVTFLVLLFLSYRRDYQLVPTCLLLLVLLAYQFRFMIRPDIFSLLFFTLMIVILGNPLDQRKRLMGLFILQVLWTNMHGFFILGPALVFLTLLSEWTKRHIKLPFDWNAIERVGDEYYRTLKIALAVVLLACLVNPLFMKGALYPFKILFSLSGESKVFFENIIELQPPIKWSNIFSLRVHFAYKLLIVLSFASFFVNFRRINVGTLIFWFAFLLFSLKAVRNIPFFAFASYFCLLNNLQDVSIDRILPKEWNRTKVICGLSILAKVLMICYIINVILASSVRGYFDFDQMKRKSEYGGVSLRNYPYKAVNFLEDKRIRGKFFNDFNSGAYILGRLYPSIQVFIDGRTEVYGEKFFKKYRVIKEGDVRTFDELADEYQLTGAILTSTFTKFPGELADHLNADKEWKVVYFDYDAIIFLRDIVANQRWIDALEVKLANWKSEEFDLSELGPRKVTPYRHQNRAEILFDMKYYDQALKEAEEALRISPSYVGPYKIIGRIQLEQKNYEIAFETLRKAKILNGNDMEARFYLGQSLYHLGKLDDAKDQIAKVLSHTPDNAKALYYMAFLTAKEKRYFQSFEHFKKAFAHVPYRVDDYLPVLQVYVVDHQKELAKKAIQMAIEANPENLDLVKLLQKLD